MHVAGSFTAPASGLLVLVLLLALGPIVLGCLLLRFRGSGRREAEEEYEGKDE
jgi:hypothetical protein